MPELLAMAVLFVVGALAASMNALAGGSLIAFPAQIALGASALHANATCSAALWLGGWAAPWATTRSYTRRDAIWASWRCRARSARWSVRLLAITSEQLFARVVPALVLLATLLLALRGCAPPVRAACQCGWQCWGSF